jgi:hypothetical protein
MSLPQNIQTGFGAHTPLVTRSEVNHFHLVPRLIVSGAGLLLLLYVIMAWKGIVLLLIIISHSAMLSTDIAMMHIINKIIFGG